MFPSLVNFIEDNKEKIIEEYSKNNVFSEEDDLFIKSAVFANVIEPETAGTWLHDDNSFNQNDYSKSRYKFLNNWKNIWWHVTLNDVKEEGAPFIIFNDTQ